MERDQISQLYKSTVITLCIRMSGRVSSSKWWRSPVSEPCDCKVEPCHGISELIWR